MELTRQEITTLINALLPTNANEEIAASNLRQIINTLNTSFYNKNDDNLNNNVSVPAWNSTLPYAEGFIVTYADKFWRSLQNGNTDNIPAENTFWTEVSKATASQNIDLSKYYLKTELQTAGQALIALANIIDLQTALDEKLNNGQIAGGDLTGTYPNPTIAPNKVTNTKLEQMPANTIKGNATGATANPQDIALQSMISGESSLIAGTRTITDSRVTANSVVLVTMSTTGVSTSVPIKYTKNAGVSVVFSTGQPTDTCNFSYIIIF